jgi:hypothetical protein
MPCIARKHADNSAFFRPQASWILCAAEGAAENRRADGVKLSLIALVTG